jgi:hypothetical protein
VKNYIQIENLENILETRTDSGKPFEIMEKNVEINS